MSNFFDFKSFRKTIRYANKHFNIFLFTIITSILFSILSASRPVLIQIAFDKYINFGNSTNNFIDKIINYFPDTLLYFIAIIFIVLLFESICQFLFINKSNYLAQSIIRDIRNDIFSVILKFRISYFDKNPTGKTLTRVTSDIEAIGQIFSQGLLVVFADIFKIFLIILFMFLMNWKLALVSISFFPFLIFSTLIFQKLMKKSFQKIRLYISKLNVFVHEHILGMNIVKIFNNEDRELKKFKEINHSHLKYNLKTVLYFSIFVPIIDIFSAVSMGLIIWYGGEMILSSNNNLNTSLGQLISFILFINMLFRPLRSMADKFNVLQMGVVASSRVFELMSKERELEKNIGSVKEYTFKQDIIFTDVNFSYKKDEIIFENFNLNIEYGKTLAIVGPTGSGKSTIINLILRFYEINSGEIYVGKRDIKSFDISYLRSNIGVIHQDPFLFSDTILNNIIFSNNQSKENVISSIKEIGLMDIINSFPNGLEFHVGEEGKNLSLGQRQIISFLRVYMSNPELIIFDEATSSLDSNTEELIKKAINKFSYSKTCIIIAHRLSTIKNANRIIFLKNGKIMEDGTHEDLLSKKGYYSDLYNKQWMDYFK